MKKLLGLFMVVALVLSVCGCSAAKDAVSGSEIESPADALTGEDKQNTEDTKSFENEQADNSVGIGATHENINGSKNNSSAKTNSQKTPSQNKVNTQTTPSQNKVNTQTTPKKTESSVTKNNSAQNGQSKVILTGITAKHIGKKLKTGDVLTKKDFEVTAQYSDKTKKTVTDFSISLTKVNTVGNNTVTITYRDKVCRLTLNVLEGNAANANPGTDFAYRIENNEVVITEYVGESGAVVIPAWIDNMPVTKIYSLKGKAENIIIPNSVNSLVRECFSDNKNLTSITFGAGIREIGDHVCSGCTNLKTVTFKNGITSIGNCMFISCSNLESVFIPDSVSIIEAWAFYGCSKLKHISFGNKVSIIEDKAFENCEGLTDIVLPDGILELGTEAFSGCKNLKSVTIGGKITDLGTHIFSSCAKLTNVTIKNGLTSIGNCMFIGCSNLKEINIPNSVTEIQPWAFASCTSLETLNFSKNISEIGYNALYQCSNLKNIHVSIGSYAERWCINEGLSKCLKY